MTAGGTADNVSKVLWGGPGQHYESVLIRHPSGRNTLCVSSQVGCALGCVFCSTGQLGLVRDLSAIEILAQASWANAVLGAENSRLRNVVFMGMGEPLLNLAAVGEALHGLLDQRTFEIAPRRITVSTSGVANAIGVFCRSFPKIRLAVSLHAARQDLRDQLMPGCRRWPLDALMPALDDYQAVTGHRLFLEYVLIGGVNDGERELNELVRLIGTRNAHVNLIPYHPAPAGSVSTLAAPPSPRPVFDAFQQTLRAHGIPSTVRQSAGESIAAACGQLAGSLVKSN